MLFLPLGKCCCCRFFFLALFSLSRRWSVVIVEILRTKHFENKESAKSTKSTSWQPAQLTLLSFYNLRSFLSSIRSLFTLPTASSISKLNIPFRNRTNDANCVLNLVRHFTNEYKMLNSPCEWIIWAFVMMELLTFSHFECENLKKKPNHINKFAYKLGKQSEHFKRNSHIQIDKIRAWNWAGFVTTASHLECLTGSVSRNWNWN